MLKASKTIQRIQNAYNVGCMMNEYEPYTLEELRKKEYYRK